MTFDPTSSAALVALCGPIPWMRLSAVLRGIEFLDQGLLIRARGGALASLRSRMASAAAWASSSDNAPAAYAFHSSADRWSSWGVRATAMARVNWSVNIESAFRAATRRRAVDSGKAKARRKKALASIQIFGKDRDCPDN
jgi:hypothetical protein